MLSPPPQGLIDHAKARAKLERKRRDRASGPTDPLANPRVGARYGPQVYRAFGYGRVYPQLFHHQRRSEKPMPAPSPEDSRAPRIGCRSATIIASAHGQYLCGDQRTCGRFRLSLVPIGELIDRDLPVYPNMTRWLDRARTLKSWNGVNDACNGLVGALRAAPWSAFGI